MTESDERTGQKADKNLPHRREHGRGSPKTLLRSSILHNWSSRKSVSGTQGKSRRIKERNTGNAG